MTSSVIGMDTQTGRRIEIPKSSRLQGLYTIGVPGRGKSELMENLIILPNFLVCFLSKVSQTKNSLFSHIRSVSHFLSGIINIGL
jgi:hypothetical protein